MPAKVTSKYYVPIKSMRASKTITEDEKCEEAEETEEMKQMLRELVSELE